MIRVRTREAGTELINMDHVARVTFLAGESEIYARLYFAIWEPGAKVDVWIGHVEPIEGIDSDHSRFYVHLQMQANKRGPGLFRRLLEMNEEEPW